MSRPGDIWQIGSHRLICGDSTQTGDVSAIAGHARAQMVFTDPPYNVPIAGTSAVWARAAPGIRHGLRRDVAGGIHGVPDIRFCASCGIFRRWIDPFSMHGLAPCRRNPGGRPQRLRGLKNICVWAKNNGGMGSLYRSQHEFVFVFKSGTAPHINNVELGKHGRYRTNVWSYAGVNSFGRSGRDLVLHPTVKPVALVADAIRDCSHRKGIVLDAFSGPARR